MNIDVEEIRARPFPRIEMRNGIPILVLDSNVLMRLPPLDAPVAQAALSANLPAHLRYQLIIARFKRLVKYDNSDLVELIEAIEQTSTIL